jgi:hypothetical protein
VGAAMCLLFVLVLPQIEKHLGQSARRFAALKKRTLPMMYRERADYFGMII